MCPELGPRVRHGWLTMIPAPGPLLITAGSDQVLKKSIGREPVCIIHATNFISVSFRARRCIERATWVQNPARLRIQDTPVVSVRGAGYGLRHALTCVPSLPPLQCVL